MGGALASAIGETAGVVYGGAAAAVYRGDCGAAGIGEVGFGRAAKLDCVQGVFVEGCAFDVAADGWVSLYECIFDEPQSKAGGWDGDTAFEREGATGYV